VDHPIAGRSPAADPRDRRIRRTWLFLAGSFFVLGILMVFRLLAGGAHVVDWVLAALVLVSGFAAALHRDAVSGLETSRRAEAESFARILQGLSRSVSPDAIVDAIVEELGVGSSADHTVIVRLRPDARVLEATLVSRRAGVPDSTTVLPVSDLEDPLDETGLGGRRPIAIPIALETAAGRAPVGVAAAGIAVAGVAVAGVGGARVGAAGVGGVRVGTATIAAHATRATATATDATERRPALVSLPDALRGHDPADRRDREPERRDHAVDRRDPTATRRDRELDRRRIAAERRATSRERRRPWPVLEAVASLRALARSDGAPLDRQIRSGGRSPADRVADRLAAKVSDIYGLKHTISAPLVTGSGVVGAIVLSRRTAEPWSPAAVRILAGAASEASAALDRAYSHRAAEARASTDALTGLPNRRYFDEFCGLLARRRRANDALGVLMIDIDHFKRINDSHGHASGDIVLRAVAGAIGAAVRDDDVPARFGGEEFAVLLRNPTPAVAMEIGERVRSAVAALDLRELGVAGVSVSVGVAISSTEDEPIDGLVDQADRALYAAKRAGRDRVVGA
jgi:diguanylate cyclase (GGDEF)-like protein